LRSRSSSRRTSLKTSAYVFATSAARRGSGETAVIRIALVPLVVKETLRSPDGPMIASTRSRVGEDASTSICTWVSTGPPATGCRFVSTPTTFVTVMSVLAL
jgi:hypothetical protein